MNKKNLQRYDFIEQLAWWEGQINASHLMAKFNITRASASNILKQYRATYPKNLTYNASTKACLPTAKFSGQCDLHQFSYYLNAIGSEHDENKLSICAFEVEAPLRNIHAEQVRPILKAIRESLAIDIGYISLSSPDYLDRIIEPHALIFDGLRWHVRAYCRKNFDYRDFVLSRFNGEAIFEGKACSTAEQDKKWQTKVDVIIQPDPRLTSKQRAIIGHDFQMKNGMKIIKTRAALVNYLLLRLRIDDYKNTPEEQQIILTSECQKNIRQYLPK